MWLIDSVEELTYTLRDMGALVRATRAELAELARGDGFWDDVFARIGGGGSLKLVCEERGWAFGEVMRTVREDEKLNERYEWALRARAEWVHEECIPIADGSGDAALMVGERRKSLKVWDRERYGEKVDVKHGGMLPVLIIEVGGPVIDVAPVGAVEVEAPAEVEGES